MTGNLTAAHVRDLANIADYAGLAGFADVLRSEAARRAVDTATRPLSSKDMERLCDFENPFPTDAPPPPAADLVARLRKLGLSMISGDPNAYLPDEAAAAIEALRAERDKEKKEALKNWHAAARATELAFSDAARAEAAEARVAALEGALRKIAAEDVPIRIVDVMTKAERKMVEIAKESLAAGGGNG